MFIKKELHPRAYTSMAFRTAVLDQTQAYIDLKKKHMGQTFVCPITKEVTDIEDACVDHVYVFRRLVDNFCRDKGISVDSIRAIQHPETGKLTIPDENLVNEWRVYHLLNASVRVTSRRGNNKRGSDPCFERGESLFEVLAPVLQPLTDSNA